MIELSSSSFQQWINTTAITEAYHLLSSILSLHLGYLRIVYRILAKQIYVKDVTLHFTSTYHVAPESIHVISLFCP